MQSVSITKLAVTLAWEIGCVARSIPLGRDSIAEEDGKWIVQPGPEWSRSQVQRKSLLLQLFALAMTVIVTAALLAIQTSQSPLVAAPHTVTPVPHAFDPDWLDVKIMIERKCLGCHRADMENRTDFSSYQALVTGKTESGDPVISPGTPSESVFWSMWRGTRWPKRIRRTPTNR